MTTTARSPQSLREEANRIRILKERTESHQQEFPNGLPPMRPLVLFLLVEYVEEGVYQGFADETLTYDDFITYLAYHPVFLDDLTK
jgi:hypothetical protein